MNIIQSEPIPGGAFPTIQTWDSPAPPIGYAIVPDHLDTTTFYNHNGFVTLTIEGDTVTAIEPNLPAWEAWKAALPPEPRPDPQEQLRADVDYLAALQGVEL